jgi:UDP:flavonoid glycosyltransferase YjiC (YdhE family)
MVRWLASRPIDAVRRRYGLRPYGARWSTLQRADHLILTDHPALFRLARRPRNHHFVGVAHWSPPVRPPAWWDEVRDDLPLVYVGVGSSGSLDVLPAILEGLGSLPVQVALATGGRPVPASLPPNARAAPYLPGDLLARRAAVVLTNGGSPALYQAWSEGAPVLAIPRNLDQHRATASMHWRGAALRVRSDRVSAGSIRRGVGRLLSEPSFRRAARQIASELAQVRAAEAFPAAVRSILGD